MEFLRTKHPEKLTEQLIIQNAQYSLRSQSKNWRVIVWRQIVLLYMSGVWDPNLYPYHFNDFWDIFCERRQRWGFVYFVIDANDMPVQSEEFRNYVKTNWLHLVNREDFRLCIVEQKAMKRAIWSSIHRLLNVQDRIKLFKNHDYALRWVEASIKAEKISVKPGGIKD